MIVKSFFLVMALVLSMPLNASLVAVSLPRFNDNFIDTLRFNIEASLDEIGHVAFIDQAESSKQKQLDQVEYFVESKVDALIVVLVDNSEAYAQQIIDLVTSNNIPLVLLNVEPDVAALPNGVTYVGSNELESGTMQMEELARLANYKGNVLLLMGIEGHHAATMRTLDVDTVLKQYPDLNVLVRERGNWERNEALKIMTRWLDEYQGQFNVIVANNDEMAIGAITAIEEAGQDPRPYFIGGVDATADALKFMGEGKLDVTVLQDAPGQAREAAQAAIDMINNKSVEREIWVPFKLVTPDNLSQFTK
ncbi:substrate-binding domain-containing protein [Marinomonas sp. THO17]|uniref:substrate-binding domain-containing protein n=1 Tax=Marinomonas sp. THO17 TaxID=3149048 RepID=UPI00336C2557